MLVEKTDNALRLSALDHKAASLGLALGQPLANARAMVPELEVLAADHSADLELLTQIADWCDRFTPFVALDGPQRLLLDITGVSHLFGGEREMLDCIRERLGNQGFTVRGALAGTAAAARALARYQDGAIVICGEEETAVRPLPVEALGLDAVTIHALRRAGLKTVGQVAARKRSELVARLGTVTLDVLDEILGSIVRPITPLKPSPDYWQEQKFAEPVATEEVIRATLDSLTTTLVKTLEELGEGARRLEAVFFRADGIVRRISIELGASTRDPAVIGRLFRERLATLSDPLDPGFGFDLVRLCASRVEKVEAEVMIFGDKLYNTKEIRVLIDRLATRFGNHRLLRFQPHDTHIPEEAWVTVPAQHAQLSKTPWRKTRKAKEAPRHPLRLFSKAEIADFTATSRFIWRKVHRVTGRYEGPERIAMEWWRYEKPQATRDYYRIEDETGRRYWVFCDLSAVPPKWLLQGLFA